MVNDDEKFNKAYDQAPTNELLSRKISVITVSTRCVYINDFRVAGPKPYVSENLKHTEKETTIRNVLDAFSEEEILAYIMEKRERSAYFAGMRNFRDA